MFEIFEADHSAQSAFHPDVTPLLETLKESLAAFANDKRIDNPEKLFSSLLAVDNLKTHPAHPVFRQAYLSLLALEPSATCYRALLDAKQEAQSRLAAMADQKAKLLNDIEAMQEIIQKDQQAYTLAISYDDTEKAAELEERQKSLNDNIAANEIKVSLLDTQAKLIPQSLSVILSKAESYQIEAYRKKRCAELLPEFENARQDFMQACKQLSGYSPALFYETTNVFGDGRKGELIFDIEHALKQLPTLSLDAIGDELLRAA